MKTNKQKLEKKTTTYKGKKVKNNTEYKYSHTIIQSRTAKFTNQWEREGMGLVGVAEVVGAVEEDILAAFIFFVSSALSFLSWAFAFLSSALAFRACFSASFLSLSAFWAILLKKTSSLVSNRWPLGKDLLPVFLLAGDFVACLMPKMVSTSIWTDVDGAEGTNGCSPRPWRSRLIGSPPSTSITRPWSPATSSAVMGKVTSWSRS